MFGLAHQTVTKRLDGVEHELKGKRRVYLIRDAAPALMQVSSERLDPAQEIARANKERAEQIALKNAVLRHEQAPVWAVVSAIEKRMGEISAILDAIPAELKRANPSLTQTDIAMVKRALARARNSAAEVEIDWDEVERVA